MWTLDVFVSYISSCVASLSIFVKGARAQSVLHIPANDVKGGPDHVTSLRLLEHKVLRKSCCDWYSFLKNKPHANANRILHNVN